jgi:8-oxo-dGTP pyrophosphatase MutT (NUDIX family)
MTVSTPRPAATVVLIRASMRGQPFEVLMVRRHDNVAFMGGAYVFPGGRVDEADEAAGNAMRDVPDATSRFADLTPARERAFRAAAVRELEEEAGVRVNASDLVPIAHWVTPEIETRRYDTRFFLTEMPAGQEAKHDDHEMTELAWLSPREAIHRCLNDEMMLPPPTWTTLKGLTRFASVAQVFDWARTTRIVRIQPGFVRDEHKTMLTLPGDPTYPPVEGWEQPEDTRFLLRDGRWRPIPA